VVGAVVGTGVSVGLGWQPTRSVPAVNPAASFKNSRREVVLDRLLDLSVIFSPFEIFIGLQI
jgi:hypothetical protein